MRDRVSTTEGVSLVAHCWTQKIGSVLPDAMAVYVPAVQVASVLPALSAVAVPGMVHPVQSATFR